MARAFRHRQQRDFTTFNIGTTKEEFSNLEDIMKSYIHDRNKKRKKERNIERRKERQKKKNEKGKERCFGCWSPFRVIPDSLIAPGI